MLVSDRSSYPNGTNGIWNVLDEVPNLSQGVWRIENVWLLPYFPYNSSFGVIIDNVIQNPE